jgi:hypothetical protein
MSNIILVNDRRWYDGAHSDAKHPDDIACYTVNAVAWLAGDTITAHTVTGTNITVDSSSESSGIITITLSGGSDGNTGKVVVNFTTATKSKTITFYVGIDNQE